MNCVYCNTEMVERHRERLVVDACPKCRAVFFDKTELDEVSFLHKGTERRLTHWTRPPEECRVCQSTTDADAHCDVPRDVFCGRCDGLLTTIRTRSMRAEWCRGCGGILLEAAGVELLAASFDAAPDPPAEPKDKAFHDGPLEWLLEALFDFAGVSYENPA